MESSPSEPTSPSRSSASPHAPLRDASPPSSACRLATATSASPPRAIDSQKACLHVAVYDADGGTLSARISTDANAPLATLVDTLLGALPCPEPCPQPGDGRLLAVGSSLYYAGEYPAEIVRFLTTRGHPPSVTLVRDALVRDVAPRVGAVCALVHNGDCEHAVIFEGVCAPPPTAATTTLPGVRVLWRRRPRVRPCDVCGVAAATVGAIGHPIADKSPFLFCAGCHALAGKLPSVHGNGCREFPLEDPLGKAKTSN